MLLGCRNDEVECSDRVRELPATKHGCMWVQLHACAHIDCRLQLCSDREQALIRDGGRSKGQHIKRTCAGAVCSAGDAGVALPGASASSALAAPASAPASAEEVAAGETGPATCSMAASRALLASAASSPWPGGMECMGAACSLPSPPPTTGCCAGACGRAPGAAPVPAPTSTPACARADRRSV